jgi:hypothetical protein
MSAGVRSRRTGTMGTGSDCEGSIWVCAKKVGGGVGVNVGVGVDVGVGQGVGVGVGQGVGVCVRVGVGVGWCQRGYRCG